MAKALIGALLVVLAFAQLSSTAVSGNIYYVSLSGSDAVSCTDAQDVATPKRTFAAVLLCVQPGDTLYIRGGTWTERIDLQNPSKSGTSLGWITISGYPGETVILQLTDTTAYGVIKARGNRGYFIFRDFIIDGTNYAVDSTNWSIRDGNHHFILRNLEIRNTKKSALYIDADDVTVEDSYFHDAVSAGCTSGLRYYGIYYHNGSRVILRRNKIHDMPGGGIQAYPGPISDASITENVVYDNGSCPPTTFGGIILMNDNSGGNISNVTIANNVIYRNGGAGTGGAGTTGNTGGPGHGIRLENSSTSFVYTNVKALNNSIYGNQAGSGLTAYGINLRAGANNTQISNNIVLDNLSGQINNQGSGNDISYNGCKSADACGTTGKVTLTDASQVWVDAVNGDFRLKQGTNPARNAGAAVSSRPSTVGGGTDLGAYEQGELVSAVVVGGYIEVNASVMTPSLTPASGVSGFTIACVGCTGSPVVSQAVLKAGSSTVLQLTVSGITGAGSCNISLGSTNLRDSGYIGPASLGLAQGLNSVSGLAVSGPCANTVAGGGAPTPTHSRFQLDEGSGTVANDDTGNGNHGTVSSGVTWVTGANGTGVTIPTDATFRHVATTYGAGVNPSTQSFAQCAKVIPDTTLAPKIYLSSGGNGTNQRAYVGIASVGGQVQWSIGIQASGFSSSGSEFPAKNQMTLVCLVFDSATDTATLWVDGVKGALAGKSVKSYTSYTLVDNLRIGNDGTFTVNNGGFTVYMVWTWNTKPSDADLEALYASEFPSGSAVTCYGQATHKAEHVYTDGTNPIAYGQPAASAYEVVDGGGIAAVIQIDCTGTAGGAVTLRFYYSANGTDFDNEIPATLGAGGIAMWGPSTELGLNHGVATCCISGGLTANHGVTLVASNVSPTINLSTNHSYTIRLLLRFASGLVDQSIWIVAKEDTGLALANAPTLGPMRFNLVNPRGGGMF